jgi:predicted nucleotidyltransferase
MDFKERLEKLFGREVDLVEEQTLRNPILIRSINKSKQLIY